MSPEVAYDEFESPVVPGPDRQPPEPLPSPPENGQALLAQAAEHERREQEQYERYVRGRAGMKASESAVLRQKQDLSPDQRAQAERVAAQYSRAKAEAEHGLDGSRTQKRLRDELIESPEGYAAFVARAEALGEHVRELAEALTEPLAAYLAAAAECTEAWTAIQKGTEQFIRERDARNGHIRSADAVRADAAPMDCPIPADAVSLVKNTRIRPRVFSQD